MFAFWWVVLLCLAIGLSAFGCADDDDDDDNDDAGATDDDDNDDDDNNDNDDTTGQWEPVDSHRESYQGWSIVWLAGTPYEMGYQQGELLHEELAAGVDWLNQYHLLDLFLPLARLLGLVDLAYENSYPDLIQECQGLADAASDAGWTAELCLLLNTGDMLVEFLTEGFPPARAMAPGCTEIAVSGEATTDGRLYHARALDWSKIDFLIDYPIIFVRQPSDGIPHAFIGFPANLSPYSGINAAGISVASNEADPIDNTVHDRVGRSHVQMQAQILKNASTLEEARDFVLDQDHMTVELIIVTDGNTGEAEVFEMTATAIGVRPLEDGVVMATNHFIAPETEDLDIEPVGDSSRRRLTRAQELCAPDGPYYGAFDPAALIEVMRDRVNPDTGIEGPVVFDDDSSIATNGALYQIVFSPADLCFWVAAGKLPVPQQPFVGFSLGELLGLPDAVVIDPPIYP